MWRHRSARSCLALTLGGWGLVAPAWSQTPPSPDPNGSTPTTTTQASRPDTALIQALQANPTTAPYRFATEVRNGKLMLIGRVGSKYAHDVAIQTAIALGIPVDDGLVIDTAAGQVAAQQAAAAGYPPPPGTLVTGYRGNVGFGYGPPNLGPGLGYASRNVGFGYGYGPSPYANYPSLFGQVGDPFYGFEPPAISYPPWWGELTAYRTATNPMTFDPSLNAAVAPVPDPSAVTSTQPLPATDPAIDPNAAPVARGTTSNGQLEMTMDGRGVATLRGVVPSLNDRIAIGQMVAKAPGVTEVINLLTVQAASATVKRNDAPPPPPTPAPEAAPAPMRTQAPTTILSQPSQPTQLSEPAATDPTTQRAEKALADRPLLAATGAKVRVKDGVATLSGSVPTAYEAMLAFRAIQQTPGVREVDDRLAFAVPDENNRNPLAEKGRPEDVEPYLAAQIRRQVGDIAHVDAVKAQGEALEVRGTLGREADRDRFDAILRSMPLLRGFKVDTRFALDTP